MRVLPLPPPVHLGLGPQRGGGLPDAPSAEGAGPLPSRKLAFAHREGLERGPARMELRWISGDPRINPARRGGGRKASRGWKGMREVSRVRW